MKSLDYVQQPDGTFRWEMVELDEIARARDAAAAPAPEEPKPARSKRRSAIEETISQTAEYEF